MTSTTPASRTTAAPNAPASQPPTIPAAAAPTAMTVAAARETKPLGIGFPGFVARSAGASTMSLSAPMEAWSAVIETPRATAVLPSPPAIRATAATTTPSSSDGKGCDSRTNPATTAAGPRDRASRSDVDDLVEVLDQVFDQSVTPVGDLCPDPRNERVESDGRDHETARRVTADDGRSSATRSEHAFETALIKPSGATEIVDDLDDAAPDHHVSHQLRHPRVDLLVTLVGEAGAILGRIGGQAGRSHGSASFMRATEVCQTAPPRRDRRKRPAPHSAIPRASR